DLGAPLRRARREHVERRRRVHPLPAQQDRQGLRPAPDPDPLGRRLPAAGGRLKMRSIRLSLMVYFLGLLAVALGVASVLVYRTASQTLEAKRRATAQLIDAQYEEKCSQEKARLDKELLFQARTLASLTQFQFDRSLYRDYSAQDKGLMLLTLAPGPAARF